MVGPPSCVARRAGRRRLCDPRGRQRDESAPLAVPTSTPKTVGRGTESGCARARQAVPRRGRILAQLQRLGERVAALKQRLHQARELLHRRALSGDLAQSRARSPLFSGEGELRRRQREQTPDRPKRVEARRLLARRVLRRSPGHGRTA